MTVLPQEGKSWGCIANQVDGKLLCSADLNTGNSFCAPTQHLTPAPWSNRKRMKIKVPFCPPTLNILESTLISVLFHSPPQLSSLKLLNFYSFQGDGKRRSLGRGPTKTKFMWKSLQEEAWILQANLKRKIKVTSAHWVKYLLSKHKGLGSDPQNPCKARSSHAPVVLLWQDGRWKREWPDAGYKMVDKKS